MEPRLLCLSWQPYPKYPRKKQGHVMITNKPTGVPMIPALFSVCHESRQTARRHYELLILNPDIPSKVYVNFRLDIVYFSSACCWGSKESTTASKSASIYHCWSKDAGTNVNKIERLAFGEMAFEHMQLGGFPYLTDDGEELPRGMIKQFTAMRELIFVLSKQRPSEEDVAKLPPSPCDLECGFIDVSIPHALQEETECEFHWLTGDHRKRWSEWDFSEIRTYEDPDHPDFEDPRFEITHVGPLGDGLKGRLLDAELMGKNGNWDNVTMRFVVDWQLFGMHVLTVEKKASQMSLMKKRVTRSKAKEVEELRYCQGFFSDCPEEERFAAAFTYGRPYFH